MLARRSDKLGLLGVINVNFSSVKVSNLREGFLREINGCLTSGWWASINNLDSDAAIFAGLRNTGVCRTLAGHLVHSPACSTIVPKSIACSRYHHTLILVSIACRCCSVAQKINEWMSLTIDSMPSYIITHLFILILSKYKETCSKSYIYDSDQNTHEHKRCSKWQSRKWQKLLRPGWWQAP